MQVEMRYFAMVREIAGKSTERIESPTGATTAQLLDLIVEQYPRLAGARRSLMIMVNQEYVPADHPLQDGDEVALIPPVSGGDNRFQVTPDPLETRKVEALVEHPGAGAIVTFVGVVRDNAAGKQVQLLEYEAYPPAAEKMLARIADEIAGRWPVLAVAISHRTGPLTVGEASVVIAVSAAHRDAAYEASRYAIERIKQIVPIWKKEHYLDGATWVGSEAEYQRAFATSAADEALPEHF